jgi:hypothetical protein
LEIALAEADAAGLTGKRVANLYPGSLGTDHEVNLRLSRGVGVEGAEPKAQDFRSDLLTLVDR